MTNSLGGITDAQIIPLESLSYACPLSTRISLSPSSGSFWLPLPLYQFSSSADESFQESADGLEDSTEVTLKLHADDTLLLSRIKNLTRFPYLLKLTFSSGSVLVLGDQRFPCHGLLLLHSGKNPSDGSYYELRAKSSSPLRYLQ